MARKTSTIIITFPKETHKGFDVVAYPQLGGAYEAVVYQGGTLQAVWGTTRFNTAKQAIRDAKKWINGSN